ncbi:MAG: hypothetical protein M1838_002344 [Thelocarpon superellum]|nr:MAG: hypothetical protein M1838_002344 [Thelocarpon superellum]
MQVAHGQDQHQCDYAGRRRQYHRRTQEAVVQREWDPAGEGRGPGTNTGPGTMMEDPEQPRPRQQQQQQRQQAEDQRDEQQQQQQEDQEQDEKQDHRPELFQRDDRHRSGHSHAFAHAHAHASAHAQADAHSFLYCGQCQAGRRQTTHEQPDEARHRHAALLPAASSSPPPSPSTARALQFLDPLPAAPSPPSPLPPALGHHAVPWSLSALMASSDIDQKFLGHLAKSVAADNSFLSAMLFKVLGLSVLLARKLVRARKLRKLDTTRDTKSLQLYHHIVWLSREGLVMVEQYAIPMVANYSELKVLSYKLRASFYHIFVLFHNNPPATQASLPNPAANRRTSVTTNPHELKPPGSRNGHGHGHGHGHGNGRKAGLAGPLPPGLAPVAIPKPAGNFLLPAMDYIPMASDCFEEVTKLAEHHLSGSHPLRLSVKMEYAAFMYDCLRDAEASRRLAKQAIADVYNAQEGMDDEMFQDASELVRILGKMAKRGLASTPGSTSAQASSNGSHSIATPRIGGTPMPAVPAPGMSNPI